jgi:hypothetical protein
MDQITAVRKPFPVSVSVRAIGDSERTALARAACLLVSSINDRFRTFGARLMAALETSKQREGERIIRRYRHLIHIQHPEI